MFELDQNVPLATYTYSNLPVSWVGYSHLEISTRLVDMEDSCMLYMCINIFCYLVNNMTKRD
jgi:hypothetical protein